MLAFAPVLSLLFLLASQVSAFNFNVTFGSANLAPTQTLPDNATLSGSLLSTCTTNCTIVSGMLSDCGNNATCLCADSLVAAYVLCEQCMYDAVIKANVPAPDKAGSTPMLQAYSAACAAFNYTNITTAFVALKLAPDWDGPFGLGLNLVGTVFSVGAAFILGMSSLLLLSNLS